jgi:hypothetical protein
MTHLPAAGRDSKKRLPGFSEISAFLEFISKK